MYCQFKVKNISNDQDFKFIVGETTLIKGSDDKKEKERSIQAEEIGKYFMENYLDNPVFISGNLNTVPSSLSFENITRNDYIDLFTKHKHNVNTHDNKYHHEFTCKGESGKKTMDYILMAKNDYYKSNFLGCFIQKLLDPSDIENIGG